MWLAPNGARRCGWTPFAADSKGLAQRFEDNLSFFFSNCNCDGTKRICAHNRLDGNTLLHFAFSSGVYLDNAFSGIEYSGKLLARIRSRLTCKRVARFWFHVWRMSRYSPARLERGIWLTWISFNLRRGQQAGECQCGVSLTHDGGLCHQHAVWPVYSYPLSGAMFEVFARFHLFRFAAAFCSWRWWPTLSHHKISVCNHLGIRSLTMCATRSLYLYPMYASTLALVSMMVFLLVPFIGWNMDYMTAGVVIWNISAVGIFSLYHDTATALHQSSLVALFTVMSVMIVATLNRWIVFCFIAVFAIAGN